MNGDWKSSLIDEVIEFCCANCEVSDGAAWVSLLDLEIILEEILGVGASFECDE